MYYLLVLFFLGATADDLLFKFANLQTPKAESIILADSFNKDWTDSWVVSEKDEFKGEWTVETPSQGLGPNVPYDSPDLGLVVQNEARKHAIATPFVKVLESKENKEIVIQYEVRLQKGLTCGGAYIKLLTGSSIPKSLKSFDNTVPFTIMFGPDKCGVESKVHFIIRHKNPISGEYLEHHMKDRPKIADGLQTHLYTLILRADNTFSLKIDQEEVRQGSLTQDFEPPFQPPETIPDPTDKMPSDWVTQAEIPDPAATKPDDWDESAPKTIPDPEDSKPDSWQDDASPQIPDPTAVKPPGWDDDLDGDWEAPLIDNPACKPPSGCGVWQPKQIKNPDYKGKWKAPLIPNPKYKGPWEARKIPNPNHYVISDPYSQIEPMSALGIELWTMSNKIMFDNLIITTNKDDVVPFTKAWEEKKTLEDKLIAEHAEGFNISEFLTNAFTSVQKFAGDPDNFWVVVLCLASPICVIITCCVFCCWRRDEEDDEPVLVKPKDKGQAPPATASPKKPKKKVD